MQLKDKDQPEVPKKRRRTEKKENKKIVVESDEVIATVGYFE